jgi:hypothetical protein
MAALCVIAAGGAFTFGRPVLRLLVLVASVALVVNAGAHKSVAMLWRGSLAHMNND